MVISKEYIDLDKSIEIKNETFNARSRNDQNLVSLIMQPFFFKFELVGAKQVLKCFDKAPRVVALLATYAGAGSFEVETNPNKASIKEIFFRFYFQYHLDSLAGKNYFSFAIYLCLQILFDNFIKWMKSFTLNCLMSKFSL